jgi:hypothetical protein
MALTRLSPAETRALDQPFVEAGSLDGLHSRLPLAWSTPADLPPSPKRRYRSRYYYQGWADLNASTDWEHLSDFDLVLRLVDFEGLRPLLASLLGWTSPRGRIPFDPVSIFLFLGWQLVNQWNRAKALRKLADPRYADYRQRFGFHQDLPTEGGIRHFLTTLGTNSTAADNLISVQVKEKEWVEIAVQRLNELLAASVALIRDVGLVSPEAWDRALVCPDGMIHDAASRMRCTYVKDPCYHPIAADQPRACPAKEKGKVGCACDTRACVLSCRRAPIRDPEARSVYYAGDNQAPAESELDAQEEKGELRYGYRSLVLQLADPQRRFSLALLNDFLPANAREENPAAACLLQLERFYPTLQLDVAAGDAGLGYFSYLHVAYQLGAKRVVDLRADPKDKDKSEWIVRGYNHQGRPVCEFGYALTANGYDAQRRRHKWFCAQACRKGAIPLVEKSDTTYPPLECPYSAPSRPHGKIVNLAETFPNGSIRLARDVPFASPTWERLYHRARNASEWRNSQLEAWRLKRLPVYGHARGRALIALADVWLNLTTLGRLVRQATAAAHGPPGS